MPVDPWLVYALRGNDLYALWGAAPDDVFAVGDTGTIQHFDGEKWALMDCPVVADLRDVWGTSGTDVYAVGWESTILHYDGEKWSEMSVNVDGAALFEICGFPDGEIIIVGRYGTNLRRNR